MAEFSPLTQLRDIHLPKEALNWPPAPGWFILLIIIILAILGIIIFIKRNFPIWQTKRHALQLLKNYQKQYQKEQNSQKTCALINELLKKTAFFYYERSIVASLKGQDWLSFLNQTMHRATINHKINNMKNLKQNANFNLIAKELLEYPYQNSQNVELGNLFNITSIWIKNQRNFSQKCKERLCSK